MLHKHSCFSWRWAHGRLKHVEIDNYTYLLTPWCTVLLEKLTGLQLVKKFPIFHGTRRFITALTSVCHLSLSWASPIQSIYLLEIHPNIIHPSMPRSPQWSLSLRFPHQDPIHPPLLTHMCHMPSPSHSSQFYHPHNIGWGERLINILRINCAPSRIYLQDYTGMHSQQNIKFNSLFSDNGG